MPLVNRPAQSFGFAYDSPNTNVELYATPGGLVVPGRQNFDDAEFHTVSAGGGTVLIYLDVLIDNPYGLYHGLLHEASEYGPATDRWPGDWEVNPVGAPGTYLVDFRVGSVALDKLEAVLERMVTDNPHVGGFFMDDCGTKSYYPGVDWDDFGAADPNYQNEYRAGAIAICQITRTVCDRHGLIFIVNGTWGAGSLAEFGGGYPEQNEMGCSLADGGLVEHHEVSELPYWIDYCTTGQWATESPYTDGTEYMLAIQNDDESRDAFIASDAFAYVATQTSPYNFPPVPYSTFVDFGLPSRVTGAAYTELEWSLKVQAPAVDGDVYEFRVYAATDHLLEEWAEIPALTIGPLVVYFDEAPRPVAVTATVTVTESQEPSPWQYNGTDVVQMMWGPDAVVETLMVPN